MAAGCATTKLTTPGAGQGRKSSQAPHRRNYSALAWGYQRAAQLSRRLFTRAQIRLNTAMLDVGGVRKHIHHARSHATVTGPVYQQTGITR